MKEIENLINSELPLQVIHDIVGVSRAAYDFTVTQVQDNPFLHYKNDKMMAGWMRYIVVNNALGMAANSGIFGKNVEATWEPVSSSIDRLYLETDSVRFQTAHIDSVTTPSGDDKTPRIGPTREPGVLLNQELLPLFENELPVGRSGKLEAFFLHGNKSFDFFHIGITDSLEGEGYRYLSNGNYALKETPATVSTEQVEEFKVELKSWVSKEIEDAG